MVFTGNTRPEVEVLGFVDFAHASRADRAHDPISSCEDQARIQRPGQYGRPHPLPAEQADVEQSVRIIAVAEHQQGFVAQFRVAVGARADERFAVRCGLLHGFLEHLLDLGPAFGGHSNLRISFT
jgi:hypothetical protein